MDLLEEFNSTIDRVGIQTDSIGAGLITTVRENKAPIIRALGLNEETMRLKTNISVADGSWSHIPELTGGWLRQLAKDHDFTVTTTPRATISKNGTDFKATRFLKNLVETNQLGVPGWALESVKAKDKEGVFKESIFWSKLGEILNSPSIVMYLSANPSDILTCSHDGGFSSCLRPGGEYFSGVASYLLDSFTFLCYVGDPLRKTGRTFCYLGASGMDFLFGKGYGSFPEYLSETGRKLIASNIASNAGLDNHWIKRKAALSTSNHNGVYFDGSEADFIRHVSERDSHKQAVTPNFISCTCIVCDGRVRSCAVLCSGCGSADNYTICENCEHAVDEDDVYNDENGNRFCEECYHDIYTQCEGCGREMDRDGDTYSTPNDEYVCEGCFSYNFFNCYHCGDAASLADSCSVNGGDLFCPSCVDDQGLVLCNGCGEYSDDTTSTDTDAYCSCCVDNHLTQCDGCSEHKDNEDVNEHGYCDDCEDERFSNCDECGDRCTIDSLNDDDLCPTCEQNKEEAV